MILLRTGDACSTTTSFSQGKTQLSRRQAHKIVVQTYLDARRYQPSRKMYHHNLDAQSQCCMSLTSPKAKSEFFLYQ